MDVINIISRLKAGLFSERTRNVHALSQWRKGRESASSSAMRVA